MTKTKQDLRAIHTRACTAVMKIDRTLTPDVDAFWPLYLEAALTNIAAQPEKIAPVQGYTPGIPWSLHLEAYDAYCKRWSPQPALIDLEGRHCRGGFHTQELDDFIPGWRDRVSELGRLKARVAELEAKASPPVAMRELVVHVAGEAKQVFAGTCSGARDAIEYFQSAMEAALARNADNEETQS